MRPPRSGVFEEAAARPCGRRHVGLGPIQRGGIGPRQPASSSGRGVVAARSLPNVPVGAALLGGGGAGLESNGIGRGGRPRRLAVVTRATDRVSVGYMKKSLDNAVRRASHPTSSSFSFSSKRRNKQTPATTQTVVYNNSPRPCTTRPCQATAHGRASEFVSFCSVYLNSVWEPVGRSSLGALGG